MSVRFLIIYSVVLFLCACSVQRELALQCGVYYSENNSRVAESKQRFQEKYELIINRDGTFSLVQKIQGNIFVFSGRWSEIDGTRLQLQVMYDDNSLYKDILTAPLHEMEVFIVNRNKIKLIIKERNKIINFKFS